MNPVIEVVDSIEIAFAEKMEAIISEQLRLKQELLIALSGGPTATKCYRYFFKESKAKLDFKKIHIIVGDERCVGESDPDSNFGMIKSILADNFVVPASLVPLDCASLGKETAELITKFKTIDIIHLGLGSDGHTASLFPDSPALNLPKSEFIALNQDIHGINPHQRITLTFEPINAASCRIITVSGKEKATILRQALSGSPLPVNRLNTNNLIWLVNNQAAEELTEEQYQTLKIQRCR